MQHQHAMHDLLAIPFTHPWVVSVVDIRKEVMNVVLMIIQILKMSSAVCMVCILWHVQILRKWNMEVMILSIWKWKMGHMRRHLSLYILLCFQRQLFKNHCGFLDF